RRHTRSKRDWSSDVCSSDLLLVLDYEGRNKTVKASEMADIDQSGTAFGEGPRVAAFKGEQAITSAMIDLVEGKKKTLGYVTGHKIGRASCRERGGRRERGGS